MYGIRTTTNNAPIDGPSAQDKTLESTLRSPMIELTKDFKRFGTVEHTFAANPTVGANTELFRIPHGYTYRPAASVYAATDYNFSDISQFFLLERFMTDIFSGDSIYVFEYTDLEHLFIKVRREVGGAFPTLVGSTWRFVYRIYALDG